ncbi:odorant-binding protein-like [Pseudorca crassidens]|uniref:odorant-binding protein-like n=1 Tax=Pseudorca crassidens TaxID=82174 RepID=UPI00352CDFCD
MGEFCFHLSGEWKTLYVASNNPEKTSENGPFKVYMRNIHLDDENDRAAFNFFVKVKIKSKLFLSENALRMYNVNMDELDKTTKLTGLTGRGNNTKEEDFEKFKQMTREEGIPEENTVNVTEAGNRIILFPECILHLACKYAIGKQVN